jgi:hypothetical protein
MNTRNRGGQRRRRDLLRLCAAAFLASGAAGAWPPAAGAQQPAKVPRVGWIWAGRSLGDPAEAAGFRQGLREFGYIEGQNIISSTASARAATIALPISSPSWCSTRRMSWSHSVTCRFELEIDDLGRMDDRPRQAAAQGPGRIDRREAANVGQRAVGDVMPEGGNRVRTGAALVDRGGYAGSEWLRRVEKRHSRFYPRMIPRLQKPSFTA